MIMWISHQPSSITAKRLRWLGHAGRMEKGRVSHFDISSSCMVSESKKKMGRH
jgi:hypothetical protein